MMLFAHLHIFMKLKLIYDVTIALQLAVGPTSAVCGEPRLESWEQALRRLPGKGISDTVVWVEVFDLGNKKR